MKKRWLAWALTAALAWGGWSGAKAALPQTLGTMAAKPPMMEMGAVPPTIAGDIFLRVIARDNSEAAQAEKLRCRDAVIAACPSAVGDLGALLVIARQVCQPFAPCRVEGRLWAPEEGLSPAPTVYITLGPGTGRNWWGVLYRNALLWAQAKDAETEQREPAQAGEQGQTVPQGSPVAFVWPALEWLLRLLGLDGQ